MALRTSLRAVNLVSRLKAASSPEAIDGAPKRMTACHDRKRAIALSPGRGDAVIVSPGKKI